MSAQPSRRPAARRVTARHRAVAAVALGLLVPVGLTACTPRAGAAANVGGERLTVSQVQADTLAVIAAAKAAGQTGLDPAEVNRRQIDRFVTDRLVEVAAERRGITVSDAEVDSLIDQAAASSGRQAFEAQLAASQLVPPSDLRSFARAVALNQKLVAELAPQQSTADQTAAVIGTLGRLSNELGTSVSPRYGAWDPSQLTVTLPPDDLSTPAPSATASTGTQVQQ